MIKIPDDIQLDLTEDEIEQVTEETLDELSNGKGDDEDE